MIIMQHRTEWRDNDSPRRFQEMELERQNDLIQAHNAFVKRSITKTVLVALVIIGVTLVLLVLL
jgi:hypothetical protein